MTQPFEGIRIIDATHVLAGPFAAYQLALLGADVQNKGLFAIYISSLAVFVFMLVYYRFAGVVAAAGCAVGSRAVVWAVMAPVSDLEIPRPPAFVIAMLSSLNSASDSGPTPIDDSPPSSLSKSDVCSPLSICDTIVDSNCSARVLT